MQWWTRNSLFCRSYCKCCFLLDDYCVFLANDAMKVTCNNGFCRNCCNCCFDWTIAVFCHKKTVHARRAVREPPWLSVGSRFHVGRGGVLFFKAVFASLCSATLIMPNGANHDRKMAWTLTPDPISKVIFTFLRILGFERVSNGFAIFVRFHELQMQLETITKQMTLKQHWQQHHNKLICQTQKDKGLHIWSQHVTFLWGTPL